ncbi:MAG: AsmA family protein [Campylobacterota bacterium]|nr:AsmA family protein [Campylobacterota bacterium]
MNLKNTIKYILIIFTTLLFISTLVIYLFFQTIDKKELNSFVSEAIGQKIEFEDFKLSFSPMPNCTIYNLKVFEREELFADTKEVKIDIELISLFSTTPKIKNISIQNAILYFKHNNKTNTINELYCNLDISNINKVIVKDMQGRLDNTKFKSKLIFEPDTNHIEGNFVFDTINLNKYINKSDNNSSSNKPNFSFDIKIMGKKITYDKFSGNNFLLDIKYKDHIIEFKKVNFKQLAEFNNVNIKGRYDFKKAYIDTDISFKESSIKRIADKFNIILPETNSTKVFNNIELSTQLKGDKEKLYLKNGHIVFDNTKIDIDMGIKEFDFSKAVFSANIDSIDLNKYIPVKDQNQTISNQSNILEQLEKIKTMGSLNIKQLTYKEYDISNLFFKIKARNGIFDMNPVKLNIYDGLFEGIYKIDINEKNPSFHIKHKISNLNISELLESNTTSNIFEGKANLLANIHMNGNNIEEMKSSLNGNVVFYGDSLIFNKYDIDNIINRYDKAKNIDLLDIAALLAFGPLGGAVSHSLDLILLNNTVSTNGHTNIDKMMAAWNIQNGIASAKDVAIKTQKNRIAINGNIDLKTNTFNNLKVAVLDKKGCAKYLQSISLSGKDNDIKSKEDAIGIVVAPIISIFDKSSKLFEECEVFYNGSIK